MSKQFIAIAGDTFSGKSTAAEIITEYLTEAFQYEVLEERIDNSLRDATVLFMDSFGLKLFKDDLSHRKLFDDRDWKEGYHRGLCPVEIMKTIGEGARKTTSPTFWLDLLLKRVEFKDEYIVVISDLRNINDFNKLKELGALVIYSHAPDNPRPRIQHTSTQYLETIQQLADFTVFNMYDNVFSNTLKAIINYRFG